MTKKQKDVLTYIRRHPGGSTPTQIGEAHGHPYHKASAWAAGAISALVRDGHVARQMIDGRVLYKAVGE